MRKKYPTRAPNRCTRREIIPRRPSTLFRTPSSTSRLRSGCFGIRRQIRQARSPLCKLPMHQRDLSLSPARFPWPAEANIKSRRTYRTEEDRCHGRKFSTQMEAQPKNKLHDAFSDNTRCRKAHSLCLRDKGRDRKAATFEASPPKCTTDHDSVPSCVD